MVANISDNFFVFGIFDHMKTNQSKNTFNTKYVTEKNISKFVKIFNNNSWENLDLNNNAQDSFTLFYSFFVNNFENVFPEKSVEIKYKNRHPWMAKSLLKSIKQKHSLYKLSITSPTAANTLAYKTYNNKLNSIKRKAERDYFSNQLDINKSDMKKSWKIM